MALQGTLDTFSLPDVLRLLATTGKTGCLHVEGDRGRGSVWLDGGSAVAATAERALGGAPIDEIIFELLRFGRGSFSFAAGEQAPHNDQQPKEIESTLRRATQLLDEWRSLEAVVPSLSHRVSLAPRLTVDQVTIDAPRWEALVAIASGRSVGELAEILDLGELGVSRTVSDLVELGVAVVEPPGAARAPASDSRRNTGETPSRPAGEAPRRSPSKAKPEPARPEPRREPVPAPNGSDTGRTSWLDESAVPVDTAPKPRAKSASSRSPRPRRTGPTPTTVPAPPRNGQVLTGSLTAPPPPAPPLTQPLPTSTGPSPLEHRPPAPPSRTPEPTRGTFLPASLDTGRLGPSPLGHDTGQISSPESSLLPPDVSWAAEDTQLVPPPPRATAPPTPLPSTLRTSPPGRVLTPPHGRPAVNGRGDETSPHVGAMSPEARAAVEATVGRSGGGPTSMPMAGVTQEQMVSRSQLLSFLHSVRP